MSSPSVYSQVPLDIPVTITAGDSVRLPFQLTWVSPDGDRSAVDLTTNVLSANLLQQCGTTALPIEVVDLASATVLVDIPSGLTSNLPTGTTSVVCLYLTDSFGNFRQIGRGWVTVVFGQSPSTSCF